MEKPPNTMHTTKGNYKWNKRKENKAKQKSILLYTVVYKSYKNQWNELFHNENLTIKVLYAVLFL